MNNIPSINYFSRLILFKESLKRKTIDAFLVSEIHNIRYLTGFKGSSALLLITEKDNIFLTDFRYQEQAEKEIHGWDIHIARGGMVKAVKNISHKLGIKILGFEFSVSYEFYRRLSEKINLRGYKGLIERFREMKDIDEINLIKEAVRRAETAFIDVKPFIREGTKEIAISRKLEERLKKRGCMRIPFEVIVASGLNSAMPHARPTEKKLDKGDLVIIDWGGEAGGYFSDMTRTLLIRGKDLSKKREIYYLVLKANKESIDHIYPKVKSSEVDRYAREVIKKADYGKFFGHGTGHGIGLQVHELPRITRNINKVIKENMVFTIEPGIYLAEIGGVRIEDMVLVRSDGAEVLTSLPKELEIV
ncbi:MAG: aminopeptidase P family protein [Nitrospirae bacterium]|nr:aminopeptidase P family protein [Nitrospirota bacterium]